MSRSRPSSKRGSSNLKSPPGMNKENVDTIYLIQNQNEILKLKNLQVDQKIATLKTQLIHHNENVKMLEKDIDNLRYNIKNSAITEDLLLEGERKTIEDKVALLRGNNQIMDRKIAEVRQTTIHQESKIPNIQDDKINLQRQLWRVKAQRQGTIISLRNLEGEVERLRKENQQLVSKRKYYQPKQREISEQIQQRIRLIKSIKSTSSATRKAEVSKVIKYIVERIQQRKFKQGFLLIQRFGLNAKYLKKKIFMLSIIRKKYVNYLKIRGMQAFRQNFRPLKQIQKASRIIDFTRKRRIKSIMFRIWRSQAIKAQFYLIRKFQVQNQLQKLEKILSVCNLFSAFNMLKKYRNNIFHQDACKKISVIVNRGIKRAYEKFFSCVLGKFVKLQENDEIEKNAIQHTQMLIKSVYFSALAKLTRDKKIVNYSIKFRYFRQLKKLLALSKRRVLGQMLTIANQKLKTIDIASKAFTTMEFQTVNSLLRQATQQNIQLKERNNLTNENINNFMQQKKQQNQQLSLLKVSSYLKGKMQQAFNSWKNWNRVRTRLLRTLMILHNKEKNDINFAFSRIQKRRFERLKVSIRDKISSCQFSYNYLLEQNAHIKEILEKKTLELQKSKFTMLLQRLLRQQRDVKYKYFFKFLRNGNKFWKFRKSYQRADIIISTKLKIVFMFLLKQNYKEKTYEEKIEYYIQNREDKIGLQLLRKGFKGLKNELFRNKNLKRILSGIFDRNGELDRYVSYQKIKKVHLKQEHADADKKMETVKIDKSITEEKIYNTQQIIQKLTERLKYKQNSFKSLKVQALKIFYIKNIRNYVGHYINRWRDKVVHERKITNFNEILQRKTRILIKYNFFRTIKRLKNQADFKELQGKAQRFKEQIENGGLNLESLIENQEARSQKMKLQNQQNAIQAEKLEKATDRMDQIKLATHAKNWKTTLLRFIMKNWKERIHSTKQVITKMIKTLSLYVLRDAFEDCVEYVRQQKYLERIRKNLNEISTKTYRQNVGNFFKIWRVLSWNKKVQQYFKQHEVVIKQNQRIYDLHANREQRHRRFSDFRINDRKLRKIFDFMKKYTKKKLDNNRKKDKLDEWLRKGYYSSFYVTLRKVWQLKKKGGDKMKKYYQERDLRLMQRIYNKLQFAVWSKKTIKKLFIGKFVSLILYNINKEFLTKLKNYHRFIVVKQKDRKTYCIQKVIETFEKKRKDILCRAIRTWNRNQFEIDISHNLMRRLTRKAMYMRVQGCFYAWKRQSEAKEVVAYHTQVGEIKKREVQIARLQKFLDDFKKEKGLLLENQEGDFVVSPRFQQQKSKQAKHQNNLRYKFVSRLILTMNGYTPALKGWNNLDIYARAREKVRSKAIFVLNYLRRGDLFCAFRTWNKAAKEFKDMFQTMDRKNLIKFLCRHKDKIEMQYSRKVGIQDDIKEQLNKYKILSHRAEKRQVLCARLFARHARQTKAAAFLTWRERVYQLKDLQAMILQQKGQKKIALLEQELRDMEQDQRQLRQSNRNLKQAVKQALQIAQLVKKIVEERDFLSRDILQKQISCERLQQENQQLNSKLYLAQKQALNLLMLSKNKP